MEHRRDVRGGALWTCTASGSSRGQESAGGSQGVRAFARYGTEDAAVCGAARLPTTAADQAAQAGAVARRHRRHPERRQQRPPKQRHTAKRIFERLNGEHGFTGGYAIVKDYVRRTTLQGREMFVPLTHPSGEAQVDFGEALVVIAGVEQKAHYLVMDLPHSDDSFVAAFPAETTEAFLEGHVRAFAYFGEVPTRILYDNTKIAVAKILGGEERQRTRSFSELQSYYLFADKFGRPAKGNDKGKVEGLVGYARRNFMVPIPRVPSWEELNAHLEQQCRKRRERRLRGHTETIGERFERDRAALLPLPAAPYEACEKISARVSSLSLVRYRSNDYSVPTEYSIAGQHRRGSN
jgi:transposase